MGEGQTDRQRAALRVLEEHVWEREMEEGRDNVLEKHGCERGRDSALEEHAWRAGEREEKINIFIYEGQR